MARSGAPRGPSLLPFIAEPTNGRDGAHCLVGQRRDLVEDIAQNQEATTKGSYYGGSPANSLHGPGHLSHVVIGPKTGSLGPTT